MTPETYHRLRSTEGGQVHSILLEMDQQHFAAFMAMVIGGAQLDARQLFGPKASMESLIHGRAMVADIIDCMVVLCEKMKAA
jgi:hypothetical protein